MVACCAESAALYVIVNEMQKVEALTQHSDVWRDSGANRCVWPANEIMECLCWQKGDSGDFAVVRM